MNILWVQCLIFCHSAPPVRSVCVDLETNQRGGDVPGIRLYLNTATFACFRSYFYVLILFLQVCIWSLYTKLDQDHGVTGAMGRKLHKVLAGARPKTRRGCVVHKQEKETISLLRLILEVRAGYERQRAG